MACRGVITQYADAPAVPGRIHESWKLSCLGIAKGDHSHRLYLLP